MNGRQVATAPAVLLVLRVAGKRVSATMEVEVFPRLKLRTAGAGESTPGKFVHTPPKNAPRYDLTKPRHLPDPDLSRDVEDDPDLDMNDPDLSVPNSIAMRIVARR